LTTIFLHNPAGNVCSCRPKSWSHA
jgi:hypothetical protein